MIKIVCAASWFSRRRFYSFSHQLYRKNKHWREPAIWRGRRVLSPGSNGLLRHPHALLLAVEGKRILARILIGTVGERGYFTLFDAENNEQAVRLLMDEAAVWQERHGAKQFIGPIAPGEIDMGGGILTEGFGEDPALNDVYNMPYYEKLLEGCGLRVFSERLVYRILRTEFDRKKYRRAARWATDRFGYDVKRDLARNPRKLAEAVCEIMGSEAEGMNRMIGAVCRDLLPLMCPVVYRDGRPVGVLLTMKHGCGRARITMIWVQEQWRGKGVQAVLLDAAADAMEQLKLDEIDASWIDSENYASRLGVESAGGRIVRRYRLYCEEFKEKITKK